jgi:hypothetical protein
MRPALLALMLIATACESDPTIACNTDDQCLSGQRCSTGICRTAADDGTMPDADGDAHIDATSDPYVDASIDAAPVTCTPACTGTTPYCVGGSCVQCRTALDCPLTAPSCSSSHVCTL